MLARKLKYLILPNHYLYESYNGPSFKIFENKTYPWKEIPQISEYWHDISDRTIYSHRALTRTLKNVVDDVTNEPCSFYKDKLFIISNLYYQMNIGETLFIMYESDNVKAVTQ
jgi:hypothetical protein